MCILNEENKINNQKHNNLNNQNDLSNQIVVTEIFTNKEKEMDDYPIKEFNFVDNYSDKINYINFNNKKINSKNDSIILPAINNEKNQNNKSNLNFSNFNFKDKTLKT